MRIHVIDTRRSDAGGLWADLPGHEDPLPSVEVDGLTVAADPIDVCARRDCPRLSLRAIEARRLYGRRTSTELVGLCLEDFEAHRAGESFLVSIPSNR